MTSKDDDFLSPIGNGPGDPNTFNVRNLRQEAGNAVAYGMRWEDALRAITLTPAEVLGIADRAGSLNDTSLPATSNASSPPSYVSGSLRNSVNDTSLRTWCGAPITAESTCDP